MLAGANCCPSNLWLWFWWLNFQNSACLGACELVQASHRNGVVGLFRGGEHSQSHFVCGKSASVCPLPTAQTISSCGDAHTRAFQVTQCRWECKLAGSLNEPAQSHNNLELLIGTSKEKPIDMHRKCFSCHIEIWRLQPAFKVVSGIMWVDMND